MLILGIIFVVLSYIITILNFKTGKYWLLYSFLYILISIEWAYLYLGINICYNMSKADVINEFILFFATNKMSGFKYFEIVTWFSRQNHYYFIHRSSEEQEIDNLIIKLELFLRPSVNGLCLACYHEKIFRDLCKKINGIDIADKIDCILKEEEKVRGNVPERDKLFHVIFDHNILIYLVVIGIHIVASVLISKKELLTFIGNLLFYLPSDILIILLYKGIIKDRR